MLIPSWTRLPSVECPSAQFIHHARPQQGLVCSTRASRCVCARAQRFRTFCSLATACRIFTHSLGCRRGCAAQLECVPTLRPA